MKIPGLGAITIAEYQWNRPKTVLYPGGGRRKLEYDGLMRLTHLSATDPGGNALLEYAYDYDGSGNIITKTTGHGTYSYGYDGVSRLTSADNPTLDNESYSYDAVGNRTAASNATGSISHNANNELTIYGELEYVYDENGNMTEVTLNGQIMFRYHYNADNRLVKVEGGNSNTIAEYYYDPFGRRLWKDVAGTRTYFFYSDEGLVAEYDGSGSEIRSYGYQPDSTWTTDPLFLTQNGNYYFYQNDHLGTPQKLVAQNGAVVWSATYSAFGQAAVQVETVTNNLRFPGQYFDNETGLHFNFQRYYDPDTGRYVSADRIKFEGGVNFFAYTFNNPGKHSDPTGLGIHPQFIIPPDEAYDRVFDATLRYHGSTARTLVNALGFHEVAPGDNNRFVFTCKYGWIDMGHFFQGAEWGYRFETFNKWRPAGIFPDSWLAHGSEIYQKAETWNEERGHPTLESVYTVEDLLSNKLGIIFGRELAKAEPGFIDKAIHALNPTSPPPGTLHPLAVSSKWLKFLVDSGAVHYDKFKDKIVYEDLQQDALMYWETSCYIVTEEVLSTLRNDEIPDTVIGLLNPLLDQKVCNEEEFRAYLRVTLGVESAAAYGDRIMEFAHKDVTYTNPDHGEDRDAVYEDKYRQHWNKVKCESRAYRQYCCCPESISAFDCQDKCQTGECQERPVNPDYWFPPHQ